MVDVGLKSWMKRMEHMTSWGSETKGSGILPVPVPYLNIPDRILRDLDSVRNGTHRHDPFAAPHLDNDGISIDFRGVNMEKLVLIDGHSILNRAFYGVPNLTNSEGLHTNAVYGF